MVLKTNESVTHFILGQLHIGIEVSISLNETEIIRLVKEIKWQVEAWRGRVQKGLRFAKQGIDIEKYVLRWGRCDRSIIRYARILASKINHLALVNSNLANMANVLSLSGDESELVDSIARTIGVFNYKQRKLAEVQNEKVS